MDEQLYGNTIKVEDGYIKLPLNFLEMIERPTSPKKSITLNEWYDRWLEFYKKNQIKAGTLESYRQLKSSFIKNGIGEKVLDEITSDDIQLLYNNMYEKGYSTVSIKIVASILGCVLKKAVNTGHIAINPADNAILPKNRDPKKRIALTQEQQNIFMEYAKTSPLFTLYSVLLRTGMRNGEIRGLKWSDIDFDEKLIHIRRTMRTLVGNAMFEDDPKTKTSKRDIPMNSVLENLLKSQIKGKICPSDFVFTVKKNHPVTKDILGYDLKSIIVRIQKDYPDFPYFSPHSLRHTFATRAIEAGMSPQVLKTIMGHSSLSMTMDLYCHIMPETKMKEMELISSAF